MAHTHRRFHGHSIAIFALTLSAFLFSCAPAARAEHETAARPPRAIHVRSVARQSATPRAALPFDRVIRPGLSAGLPHAHSAVRLKQSARVRSADSASPAPNFGGFLAAPKYRAWNAGFEDSAELSVFTAGDFNGDGKPDIVTVQNSGSINVLLNQGNGKFSAPVSTYFSAYYLGGTVQAIAADMNKDGKLDLVLLDAVNNGVDVLLGNGDGTFAAPTLYSVSTFYVASIDLADLNGDGYPDVVQISGGQDFSSTVTSTIEIDTLLNDKHGALLAPSGALTQCFSVAGWTDTLYGRSVALSDISSDGLPDLTLETLSWLDTPTPTPDSTHVIQTFLGNGDGSFASPYPGSTINIPSLSESNLAVPQLANLNVVDINNDGFKDIIFSLQDYSIYLLVGSGYGAYQPYTNIGAYHAYPTDLVVADLNGDGLPELIDAEPGYISVYQNLGGGNFSNEATEPYGSGVGNYSVLAVADFNGDKTPDVALMNSSEDSVTIFDGVPGSLPSLRAASLLSPQPANVSGALAEAVLDTNGDGNDDIVLFNTQPYVTSPSLTTALGDGKGNFVFKTALLNYTPGVNDFIDSETGDFNGDGRNDLILHTDQGVSLLLSNGDGTFTARTIAVLPFACITGKGAIGDVNGDGKLDVVIAYGGDVANPTCELPTIGAPTTPSGIFTLLGKGDGTFQAAQFTAAGSEAFEPVLFDANGDGKLDVVLSDVPFSLIALGSSGTFNTLLLLGKGDGTFQPPSTLVANNVNTHTMAGDVNGDGKTDLVILTAGDVDDYGTIDPSTAGVLTLVGKGDGTFTPQPLYLPGFSAAAGLLADFNGDGRLDLALSELYSQDFTDPVAGGVVALGNGDATFTATHSFEAGAGSSLILAGDFMKDAALDAVYVSSTGGSSLLINQGGTTVALTATPASIYQGQDVSISAKVTAALAGKPQPTGTITLMEAGATLGSGPVDSGSASITLTGLAIGTHIITAAYSGDSNFNANSSTSISIAVAAPPPAPAVSITGAPLILDLTRGQTGSVTFTAIANATFTGSVALQVSGAPEGMTTLLSPPTIALTQGQSGNATLVVSTTSPHSAVAPFSMRAGGAASLAALFLLVIPRRVRKRMSRLALLALGVLALAGILGMEGCGGSSIQAAPRGSTTLTVTATPTGLPAQTFHVTVNVQ
jgi:hypothetical protein